MKDIPRAYVVSVWSNQGTVDRKVMAYTAEDAIFQVAFDLKRFSSQVAYIDGVRPWGTPAS